MLRDIGSAVFPNADCKIFLKADIKVRTKRRLVNLIRETQKNNSKERKKIYFELVYKALKERDERDSKRKISPMNCDESYIILDNSKIGIEETFEKVKEITEKKIKINII